MTFKSISIKPFYNSKIDDILNNFYIPILSNATIYKRVSAYFDSQILSHYAKGIEQIVIKKGHIQFIFSCQITKEDFLLIKQGYENRKEYLSNLLLTKIEMNNPTFEIKNLAYLIKYGFIDIKIAFTKSSGVFHDKFGIVEADNEKIYFRGSNNETVASILSNFESFETTCSWNADENEILKITNANNIFSSLWNNNFSDDIFVIDIPTIVKNKLISYGNDKLNFSNQSLENVFIMDYNHKLITTNKISNPLILSPKFNFYKRELESYIVKVENNQYSFKEELSYRTINTIIEIIYKHAQKYNFSVFLTPKLQKFLFDNDIKIEKRYSLGVAIKSKNEILYDDFDSFSNIISQEMTRKLRDFQLWGAYHITKMIRSANFSVPGTGKTSIVYGAFAFLSSDLINEVNKILVIGPINSFSSWQIEFAACFGNKRQLKVFDYQKEKSSDSISRYDSIVHNNNDCNLILFNYESIVSNLEALRNLIDNKTLLVFDEVHRIKAVLGKRAKAAKEICKRAKYRVVLTGTPLPNGYIDIFNLLNILFSEEYDDYFGFDESFLKNAKESLTNQLIINNKLYPFFCRTTKNQLNIPKVEPDNIICCQVNSQERLLFEILYRTFSSNILLLYIRLMQASTNPKLVLSAINKEDFDFVNLNDFNNVKLSNNDRKFIESLDMTSKFYKGIEIITKKINNGPIIVWAIFRDTINKIKNALNLKGVRSQIINGSVEPDKRDKIILDFKKGLFNVLITNPHTLGESISLHEVCHQAIYFEFSFNLVHMLQSRDRIHRLGLKSTDKTEYTFMILDDAHNLYSPIDLKIYQRLHEKESLQNKALSSENLEILVDDLESDVKSVLA